jgi:hypothetical protein
LGGVLTSTPALAAKSMAGRGPPCLNARDPVDEPSAIARGYLGELVEHLTSWATSGLAALHGLSLLQLGLLGALGLGLCSWVLGMGLRSVRRAVQTALLLIAAVAVMRLCFPETFCTVRWPSPIASLCSR